MPVLNIIHATRAGTWQLRITDKRQHRIQGDFRYISKDELKQLGDSGLRTHSLEQLLSAVPLEFRPGVAEYKGTELLAGAFSLHL